MAHRHVDVRRSTKIARSQAERYYHEAHEEYEGKNWSVSLLFPFVLVMFVLVMLLVVGNHPAGDTDSLSRCRQIGRLTAGWPKSAARLPLMVLPILRAAGRCNWDSATGVSPQERSHKEGNQPGNGIDRVRRSH